MGEATLKDSHLINLERKDNQILVRSEADYFTHKRKAGCFCFFVLIFAEQELLLPKQMRGEGERLLP